MTDDDDDREPLEIPLVQLVSWNLSLEDYESVTGGKM